MLTISPNRLREISDPILQMLHQLHKIIYITQVQSHLSFTPDRDSLTFRLHHTGTVSPLVYITQGQSHLSFTSHRDSLTSCLHHTETVSPLADSVTSLFITQV